MTANPVYITAAMQALKDIPEKETEIFKLRAQLRQLYIELERLKACVALGDSEKKKDQWREKFE